MCQKDWPEHSSVRGARLFHKPTKSLRQQLVQIKDKTDIEKVCGAVYHIQCSNCEEDYIGEAERPFIKRFKEHQKRKDSAFHQHLTDSGHSLDLKNSRILSTELHPWRRKVKEAINIKLRRPSLNRDLGVELPPVYDSVINSLRTQVPLSSNSME